MSNLLDNVNFKSIRSRIVEFLIQKTDYASNSLPITHDTLSIELGTAREVISRTLKSLENEGLFKLSRGRINDIRRDELEKLIEA